MDVNMSFPSTCSNEKEPVKLVRSPWRTPWAEAPAFHCEDGAKAGWKPPAS